MLISNNKKNLIINSLIEIDETDGKGKGHYFQSRFIEPGVAHYDNLGDILIKKETLDKFLDSMVGCPVIINHKDVTDKNVDELRVGTISRVWFEPGDGWFYCEGIITDEQAVDLIKNQGWNVSCSYNFVSDNTQKTHNGKKINMEFTDGEFLHLAIVETPRYEGANIVVNSADKKWSVEESDEEGFVTIKYGEKSWKVPVSKLEESNKGFESYINKIISNIAKEKFDIEKFDNSGYKYKIKMTEDQYNSKIMDKVRDAFINTNKLAKAPYYENYAGDKCMILEFENKNVNNNNIGDITMTVLNDLKDFIMNVVNNEKEKDVEEKDVKNEKVDKRDIIRQIMAIAGKEEASEDVKTIAKLAEKLAYDDSEAGKADNEVEEKEIEEKVTENEDEEKEEKFEEEKEIADVKNKCKGKKAENKCKNDDEKVDNSIEETKKILFGGISKENTGYMTREERIELGNNY